MAEKTNWKALAQEAWKKCPKANAHLFNLTYGTLISTLIKSNPNQPKRVNEIIHKMGYSIGIRLIDDFMANVGGMVNGCEDWGEAARCIQNIAIPFYFGKEAAPEIVWKDEVEFVLKIDDLFGSSMVALLTPSNEGNITGLEEGDEDNDEEPLVYGGMILGVIEGALEMVGWKVTAKILNEPVHRKDCLESSNVQGSITEISVMLQEKIEDVMPVSSSDEE